MFIISLVQVGKDSFGNDYIENLKQNDISTGKISSLLKLAFITFFYDLFTRKVECRIELLDPPLVAREFLCAALSSLA